ncbi:hypothetical protein NDU88_003282 [Pleurodeles waltl]|uniref:Uncharacterized protein n=1 Tax=Pleurodeles waltl TaxID=8319 RepID=A0AAV7W1Y7_PLEWA|nr:hypothetical protein NDU88_003282 [Pleurodeles waltl]
MIHQSMMEHREETKAESRRTQLACRKMQGAVRRVAKKGSEFEFRWRKLRLVSLSWRMMLPHKGKTGDLLKAQMDETHWKLADLEYKLRQNNLRVLGVPEKAEGADPCRFIVKLFKEAFSDLVQWDREREIQRTHRFPFKVKTKSNSERPKPRAILICLYNFQARQALYDLAHPNRKRTAMGFDFFFVRPDFCHTTVEKR